MAHFCAISTLPVIDASVGIAVPTLFPCDRLIGRNVADAVGRGDIELHVIIASAGEFISSIFRGNYVAGHALDGVIHVEVCSNYFNILGGLRILAIGMVAQVPGNRFEQIHEVYRISEAFQIGITRSPDKAREGCRITGRYRVANHIGDIRELHRINLALFMTRGVQYRNAGITSIRTVIHTVNSQTFNLVVGRILKACAYRLAELHNHLLHRVRAFNLGCRRFRISLDHQLNFTCRDSLACQ